jgi:hypothetical protein
MAKCYIIIRGWGEYSDRGTTPVRVYLDRAQAEEMMAKLEAVESKRSSLAGLKFSDYPAARETLAPQMKAEYEALGFDADIYDDWELAEAELDTHE